MKRFILWLKSNDVTKNVFVLCLVMMPIGFFQPWFNMSPGVIPGTLGISAWSFLAVFLFGAYAACYLWRDWQTTLTTVLMELGLFGMVTLVVSAYFTYARQWADWVGADPTLAFSQRAIQPWYWVALGLSILPFVSYQIYLLHRLREKREAMED